MKQIIKWQDITTIQPLSHGRRLSRKELQLCNCPAVRLDRTWKLHLPVALTLVSIPLWLVAMKSLQGPTELSRSLVCLGRSFLAQINVTSFQYFPLYMTTFDVLVGVSTSR